MVRTSESRERSIQNSNLLPRFPSCMACMHELAAADAVRGLLPVLRPDTGQQRGTLAVMSGVSADIMAEVLQIIVNNLDCEGTRKLASVNKLFRERSYSAVAVAEFRESQVRLLGLFQSFQVAALRDGRARPRAGSNRFAIANGRRAFLAKIEDNMNDNYSLAELADDVRSLSAFTSASSASADPAVGRKRMGRCAADRGLDPLDFGVMDSKGVRLPLNLSMNLLSSLNDRERRLLKLGEAFHKKVVCTFRVGKQHGSGTCSVKCAQCSRYACSECQEAQRCSVCLSSFCGSCWESGTESSPDKCVICHEAVCSDCRKQARLSASATPGRQTECALCPVFIRGLTCASCAKLPHCAACHSHCSAPPRACDSCGELCCDDCIEDSPYCQLCGQFSLW